MAEFSESDYMRNETADEEETLIDYKEEDDDQDAMSDNLEVEDEESDPGDKNCMYNYAEDEDGDDDDLDIDDILEGELEKNSVYVYGDDRITKPFITKYERVRLLGDRTKQLELGAKPMFKNVDHLSKLEIAEMELEHGVIPLLIDRPLPGDRFERWTVKELMSLN